MNAKESNFLFTKVASAFIILLTVFGFFYLSAQAETGKTAEQRIINAQENLKHTNINLVYLGKTTLDGCEKGSISGFGSAEDAFRYKCTLQIVYFYSFNGELDKNVIKLEQSLLNSGWQRKNDGYTAYQSLSEWLKRRNDCPKCVDYPLGWVNTGYANHNVQLSRLLFMNKHTLQARLDEAQKEIDSEVKRCEEQPTQDLKVCAKDNSEFCKDMRDCSRIAARGAKIRLNITDEIFFDPSSSVHGHYKRKSDFSDFYSFAQRATSTSDYLLMIPMEETYVYKPHRHLGFEWLWGFPFKTNHLF